LSRRSKLTAFLLLSAVGAVARQAAAGGPIGANESQIQTSDYAIDLFQGPVFAGTRVTGLGGAYVAIAEDVDGDLQNPAAPAVRPFFSYSHFDYWLGFGITFPASLSNMDFFNSGAQTSKSTSPDSFLFFTPAVNLQWGEFAVGLNVAMQQYTLPGPTPEETIRVTVPTTHLQFARGFEHNQIVLGLGARLLSMAVERAQSNDALFKSNGTGVELGAVYKPENRPYRLGIAYRAAIQTQSTYRHVFPDENGDITVPVSGGDAYLPKYASLPWDFNFGFAVQVGPRPMNPPWRSTADAVEKQVLEHRLRQLDREERKEEALRQARSPAEAADIKQSFAGEQIADDRRLAAAERAARERTESRLREMNRFYVQLSASMLVTGPVENAVGIESFLTQTVNRSGQKTVYSPRLGVEWGAIPEFMKVRGGTYLEPTRFETSEPRLHATAGLDFKLIKWNVFGLWPDDYIWRLGLGLDASQRYYTWGFTIAGWYPRRAGQPEPARPEVTVP